MTTDDINRRPASMPIFLDGFDALAVRLRELSFGLLALTEPHPALPSGRSLCWLGRRGNLECIP